MQSILISTSRLDIFDIALLGGVSDCLFNVSLVTTYEELELWAAPPDTDQGPHPAFTETALDCDFDSVSFSSEFADTLQETCL